MAGLFANRGKHLYTNSPRCGWPGIVAVAGHKYDDKYFDENYYTAFQQISRTTSKLKGCHYDSTDYSSIGVCSSSDICGSIEGSSGSGSGSIEGDSGSGNGGFICGDGRGDDIDCISTDEIMISKKRKVLDNENSIR